MTSVGFVPSLSLRVPRRKAEKRLADLIERGHGLILLARRLAEKGRESSFTDHWSLWYGVVVTTLNEIYPTAHQAELVRGAQEVAKTWPERVELAIHAIANLKDTLQQCDEPPATTTLVRWLTGRPALTRLVDALIGLLVGLLIAEGQDMAAWIRRLLQ